MPLITSDKLPRSVLIGILVLTMLPSLLSLLGAMPDYSASYRGAIVAEAVAPVDLIDGAAPPELLSAYDRLAGPFLHTICEWSGCCVALLAGLFSFVHYRLKRDVTTPIIGTALFFSGMLDGMNVLAADRITFPVDRFERFVPFTWAVSRTFNVAILLAGTLPFVIRPLRFARRTEPQELRSLILYGVLFSVIAYAIIQIFAQVVPIPESLFHESILPRPWDLIPLILWLFTGLFVFPRFFQNHPSVFAHSLIISSIPAVVSQFHMAFGSHWLFDHHFFSAYLLKIIAYGLPLVGLMLDYGHAHRSDLALRETETKLDAAREISQSLLPPSEVTVSGIEVAGFSYAAEAVGGDYYDFIKLKDGRFAVVVGDVSGHDLAASILASQSRAYFRAYCDSLEDLSDVMTRLNNALVVDTQQRRFVTMFTAVMSPNRRALAFAAAGHQGYLIRESGEVEVLKSAFMPLGMADQGVLETNYLIGFQAGDQLLIVTDGITEAVSPDGEQYGMDRVLAFLKQNAEQPVPQLIRSLNADVDRFCNHVPPSDDVTVVLIRWIS